MREEEKLARDTYLTFYAFAQNIETVTGEPYVAQLLTQTEVDAILGTPMEKCNKSSADGNAVNACRGKCLGWMK